MPRSHSSCRARRVQRSAPDRSVARQGGRRLAPPEVLQPLLAALWQGPGALLGSLCKGPAGRLACLHTRSCGPLGGQRRRASARPIWLECRTAAEEARGSLPAAQARIWAGQEPHAGSSRPRCLSHCAAALSRPSRGCVSCLLPAALPGRRMRRVCRPRAPQVLGKAGQVHPSPTTDSLFAQPGRALYRVAILSARLQQRPRTPLPHRTVLCRYQAGSELPRVCPSRGSRDPLLAGDSARLSLGACAQQHASGSKSVQRDSAALRAHSGSPAAAHTLLTDECPPSLKPCLKRRGMCFRYCILPVPVVFRRMAFSLQLSARQCRGQPGSMHLS